MRHRAWRSSVLIVAALAPLSCAQSLFLQPLAPTAESVASTPALEGISMFAIQPPPPRVFSTHDLITIIVDENARSSSRQSLDTEKRLRNNAQLNGVLDPMELLELRLRAAGISNLDLLDVRAQNKFEGDGQYERSDRFTARITARIVDVKPNGTLVVEARKEIVRDQERSVITLTGVCRQEDVTGQNTILSSQLADLRVDQQNEGEVRRGASKGLITRVLDTIFNF